MVMLECPKLKLLIDFYICLIIDIRTTIAASQYIIYVVKVTRHLVVNPLLS